MNATKRSAARAGLVLCSALAVVLTGCRTHVVREHTRTVYAPAPPPVVYTLPAPQPPPPVVVVQPPEPAPVVVIQSESDFYEPLAAHGRWVVVGSYGRCWIPGRVEAGWRPYANGYWQRTDAGWYWASDEPWGWATYHYGRWDYHAEFGWIWVPQTQWAPAWVCWREGGNYVGWAPLRPSVTIGVNVRIGDYEPAFASRAFVFVEHRRMLEPVRPRTVIVNNTTIINQTVNITNVKIVNKTVINEGPRVEVVERASGRKVQAVHARDFRHREETVVVARERNIPTNRDRKAGPVVHNEPQPLPARVVPPRNDRAAERPAEVVTQPSQPIATPAQPAPPRREIGKPARDEMKHEAEAGRKVITTPPPAEREAKPEFKPAQSAPPRREVRPVERPAVSARPAQQPVTTLPDRREKKREAVIEKQNTATPPAVAPKPGREAKPETRQEVKPPVKMERAPTPNERKQIAPQAEKPAGKPLLSPQEKSRVAEQGEANKKRNEGKGSKKKGDEQEADSPRQQR